MSKVSFWTKTSFRSSSLTLSRKTTREKWPSLDCRCRHISDDDKNLTIQAAFRTPMRRGLLLVTFRKRCVFFFVLFFSCGVDTNSQKANESHKPPHLSMHRSRNDNQPSAISPIVKLVVNCRHYPSIWWISTCSLLHLPAVHGHFHEKRGSISLYGEWKAQIVWRQELGW